MTILARTLAASAVLAITGTVALAQPGADEPPPPPAANAAPVTNPTAPVTVDPRELNTINGQLVPVGQKNDYLIKFRRTNISTNPLGWIFGAYGVSASYALNDHIALRGDLNYFSPPNDGARGVEVGVGAPIYFRRTYQGLFLEPGIISRTFESDVIYYDSNGNTQSGGTTRTTTFGPQVLVGWHWTWDSGLNFAVAVGAGRNWSSKTTGSDYSSDEVFPNGYMRFGYAF